MRFRGRAGALVAVAALVLSACVAAPGASSDPSASAGASPAPVTTAAPSTVPASAPPCPTPLPLDPATGAMVTSIDALSALGDAAAACYGNARLELTGYVPYLTGLGGVVAYAYEPAWLYGAYQLATLTAGRGAEMPSLAVRFPPSLGTCDGTQDATGCVLHSYLQTWITVVGHFDDPASATCTATPVAGIEPPPDPIPASVSRADCRTRFVLESFAPFTATGPLPPVDPGLCPVEPITLDQLVGGTSSIGQQYGLGCLGAKEIAFDAYVVPGVGLLSGIEQYPMSPRWLADPLNTGVVLATSEAAAADAGTWLVARVPPDVPPGSVDSACDGSAIDPATCPFKPYAGKYVRVTGHYDDPESLTCRVSGGPGGSVTPGTTPITPEAVILDCREQLVVDSVAPASGPEPSPTPPTTSTQSSR